MSIPFHGFTLQLWEASFGAAPGSAALDVRDSFRRLFRLLTVTVRWCLVVLLGFDRRFRDDEFLLPRALTEGCSAIRIRVQFTPVKRPLFPGRPVAELAWSEIRYSAYCFVMPEAPVKPE